MFNLYILIAFFIHELQGEGIQYFLTASWIMKYILILIYDFKIESFRLHNLSFCLFNFCLFCLT